MAEPKDLVPFFGKYVYVADALYYFINANAQAFGHLNAKDNTSSYLIDNLPLIRKGYGTAIDYIMLITLYRVINNLDIPETPENLEDPVFMTSDNLMDSKNPLRMQRSCIS
ncbi:Hypothetical protein HVR_LOCUS967 [uncultured virus]|nr:Hypothetical protein HVR_LOCUS967 [uncultured virus]